MGSPEANVQSQNANGRSCGADFSRRNANGHAAEVAIRSHKAIVKGCGVDDGYSRIDGYPHNVEGISARVNIGHRSSISESRSWAGEKQMAASLLSRPFRLDGYRQPLRDQNGHSDHRGPDTFLVPFSRLRNVEGADDLS